MSTPTVSVVIPTRNREQLLQEVVEAVWKQDAASLIKEIVIVDNCSTDATPQRVKTLEQQSPCIVKYHRMPNDQGPAGARNAGWVLTTSKFVVFVDSDVILDRAWLTKTLAVFETEPNMGIVSGKLLYASRPDRINAYGGAMCNLGLGWDAHQGDETSAVVEAHDCLWIATAAVLIRRDLLVMLNGFDGTYFFGYEDSDFGWRANMSGYRCRCIPDALAYHRISESPSTLGDVLTFHSCKNRLRSMIKNCGIVRLGKYLPLYLAFALADTLLRPPRWPKCKALGWNLLRLFDTIRLRMQAQGGRKVSDREIDRLFSPRLFPPVSLGNRRRRLTGSEA